MTALFQLEYIKTCLQGTLQWQYTSYLNLYYVRQPVVKIPLSGSGDTLCDIEMSPEDRFHCIIRTWLNYLEFYNISINRLDWFISSFTYHESEILRYLATEGPVSVAVDASNWHNYMGGIIQYNCPANLNHAVQVVGYDMSGSNAGICR